MSSKPIDARIFEREQHEHYVEQLWCTELLLAAEDFDGQIWDPACGYGTIPRACKAAGYSVIATDIVDRGYGQGGQNFLAFSRKLVAPVDNVICNPPFDLAEAFIDQALRFARKKVAMLLPLTFLSSGGRYDDFMGGWPVSRIHFLSTRPSMPPGRFLDPETLRFCCNDPEPKINQANGEAKYRWRVGDKPAGGTKDFCWVVMTKGHEGPSQNNWLAEPGRLARSRALRRRPIMSEAA